MEPAWKKATLIKMETEDGLFEMWEHVPIGRVYIIDATTIRMAHGYNSIKKKHWYKEIVDITELNRCTGFMPTELLNIEE